MPVDIQFSRQTDDPAAWDRVKRVARENHLSLDVAPLPAGGRSNDVWLLPEVALRMSRVRGRQTLREEAEATPLLSEKLNCPELLKIDEIDGYVYTLSRRVHAFQLVKVWPYLTFADRVDMLSQCLDAMSVIQETSVSEFNKLGRSRDAWYSATEPDVFDEYMQQIAERARFLGAPIDERFLEKAIEEHARLRSLITPNVPVKVGHFDFQPANLLVLPKKLVSVTDFELINTGAPDTDLDKLMFILNLIGAEPGTSTMAVFVPLVEKIAAFSLRGEWANRHRLFQVASQASAAHLVPHDNVEDEIKWIAGCMQIMQGVFDGRNHVDVLESRYDIAREQGEVDAPRLWL